MPTEFPPVPPAAPTPPGGNPGPDVTVSWGPVPRSTGTAPGPFGVQPGAIPMAPPAPNGDRTNGGGTKGGSRRRLLLQVGIIGGAALLVVGLVVAIGLVLAGQGNERGDLTGFSGEPRDYVPKEVGGREVRTNAPVLEVIGDRFLTSRGMDGSDFELVAAMLPTGPRQPPRTVLLVLGGDGADGVMSSFEGDTKVRSDTETEISGEAVRVVEVENDDFPQVWTAISAPRDDIALVALSFGGERKEAESMVEAALESGRQ